MEFDDGIRVSIVCVYVFRRKWVLSFLGFLKQSLIFLQISSKTSMWIFGQAMTDKMHLQLLQRYE